MKDFVKIDKWYIRYAAINAVIPDSQDNKVVAIYITGSWYSLKKTGMKVEEIMELIDNARKDDGV